jgi:hypothetical protein
MHSLLGHLISDLFLPSFVLHVVTCLLFSLGQSLALLLVWGFGFARDQLRLYVGPLLGFDRLIAYSARMEAVTAYTSCCKGCGPCMKWILADGNGLLLCQS